MADKKKSIDQLCLENEELKLSLAAKEAQNDTFREAENKYTAIYNSMSEGLAIHEIIYDRSGKVIDYIITDVNPAYERIVGLNKKNAVGCKATDVYKVSTAPYLEIYTKVALTGVPQTFETYFPPMDKHFYVSVFSPSNGKFATIFQDISERKRTEKALRESEDRFSSIISNAQDVIYRLNLQTGNYEYISPSVESIVGYSAPELMTLDINSSKLMVHPDDLDKLNDAIKQTEKSGKGIAEYRQRRKNGEYRWLSNHMTITRDNKGLPLFRDGNIRDITAQKNIEQIILESEMRFRTIAETVPVLICVTRKADNIVLFTNEVNNRAFGISGEDIIGSVGPDYYYDPADRGKMMEVFKKQGYVNNYQVKVKRSDGSPFWILTSLRQIDYYGQIALISASIDITDRIKLENDKEQLSMEFESQAAWLDASISSMANGIILYGLDSKAIRMNDTAKKLLPEELLFNLPIKDRSELLNWETEEGKPFPVENIPVNLAMQGKTARNVVMAACFPDHKLWLTVNAAPILDLNGRILGVVASFLDITNGKVAEEALRESEERFRNLLKYAPTAIYEIDFKTRKFISVNDAICKLSGYSREELLSFDPMELLVEESKKLFRSRINQVMNGEKPEENVEYRIKTKDDRIIDAVFNMKFTFSETGTPSVAMVVGHDITQRKKAEKELREAGEALKVSEKRFRTLAENIPDMIVRFDTNLKLLYGNAAVIKSTGRSLDFLFGKTAKEYGASTESDKNWEKAAREVIRTGKPCRLEQVNLWHGTSMVYDALIVPEKDNSGNVNSIISIARDITEMKQGENILRKSEQRLKYHLENSPLAVVELDKEFNIIQWSNEAERIFGLKRDEVIGVRIDMLNIIFPEDIPIVEKTISRLISGKETKVVSQYRNITKDGNVRECIWYNSVLLDENGEMNSVMSLVEDITQLKQTEIELMESRESYRELVTNAQSLIMKYDNEGIFTFVNEFALEFFGYKEEELIGKSIKIVVPQTDSTGQDLNEMVDKIIKNPDAYPININENIKKNGDKVWVEWHNKTLFDLSGIKSGHIAVGIDISKRKKAEGALKESESKLRSVLNVTQESIYMFDKEGTIVLSNETGIKRLDRNEENEVVKHHISEFMTAEISGKRIQNINEVFRSGQPMTYEDERESKSYQHNLFPVIKDDEVIYAVIYSTDITEQKKAEISLKQSEDRFRTISESLAVIVFITKISDSTITFLNEPFEKSFGYKRGELLGTRMPDIFYYPDDNKFLVDSLKVKGLVENVEVRVKKSDGTSFWVLTSIRKINYLNEPSYLTASIDISETKKAQEELLRLNRTLDAQSKSSQAMMHSRNEQEYLNEICKIIIEDCGHAMVWVGYAQNDSRKSVKPVAHFGFDKGYIDKMNITWDDSDRGNGPTGTAIKTGKPSICRHMLTDPCFGPWRDAAINSGYSSSVVLPLKSEGKPFGAITIYSKDPDPFTDSEIDLLSELADDLAYGILFIRLSEYEKEATRAIRENEVRLKELISTKDKFFNIIAHDLKNPFTSLLGASELLYDNIDQMSGDNVKKLALILNDSAKGGYSILQNLLDWSRSQTGQLKFNPENVNLKSIIDENIENLQLQVNNKEINLKSELIEPLFVTADKNMINTVLRNLLSNAVKYTFRNGNIHVMVAKGDSKITLTVKDSGIGISKEKADSLFMLESSLSIPGTAKEQGTGLGLKLCKEFTEKMGGRIWVESEAGKGSEFKFTIPVNGVKA